MDAVDFISLAGKLSASADAGEAAYRTAVSRAYYGAFHLAKSFLAELGFSAPRTANVHVFAQHHLNGSGQPSRDLGPSTSSCPVRGAYNEDK